MREVQRVHSIIFCWALLSPGPVVTQEPLAVDTLFRVDGHEHTLDPFDFVVGGPNDEVVLAERWSCPGFVDTSRLR